jgi:hypothetical protein
MFSGDPLSPEEEAALEAGKDEKGKNKGEKKDGKKDGKGKKGGGKSKENDGVDREKVTVGPSEVVMKFEAFYEDYENIWDKREDSYSELWDKEMLRAEVMPEVTKKLKV